ncbi:nucleoside deaminase [Halanaerobiaceae bacterium Z-7014]|uniref:tRNA-specific adenosine deaminase n=1 Tax=Halonatronomonas betaini TaxID=2778430 RepID=A0A931F8P2_9FIRM|nr:tRNA adenosine(34) deaminase TadA [Halonatronomonas betaini]MBF8437966.1 nucleoside deaminase [Halonatronomonas betaini]
MNQPDNYYMDIALEEARKAAAKLEVPVGAVVVNSGQIIGRGHNLREASQDPTSHAEMIAIRAAAKEIGSWRLEEADLYVTLEPCPMCAGAILQARLKKVVYGATDPKAGAAGALYNLLEDNRFNHQVELVTGVRAEESSQLLKDFFRQLRLGKDG